MAGAERVGQLPGHDRIGGIQGSTCRAQDGVPGVLVDRGIGIHLRVRGAAGGHLVAQVVGQAPQAGDVHPVMGQFDVGQRGRIGLAALQDRVQTAGHQAVFDGIEALGALGMTPPHFVLPASLVGEIAGGQTHLKFTVWFAA